MKCMVGMPWEVRLKGDMGPNCHAREEEEEAGKRGAGSPPITQCSPEAGTRLLVLCVLSMHCYLVQYLHCTMKVGR